MPQTHTRSYIHLNIYTHSHTYLHVYLPHIYTCTPHTHTTYIFTHNTLTFTYTSYTHTTHIHIGWLTLLSSLLLCTPVDTWKQGI